MRAVVQRVRRAEVLVGGASKGAIGQGLCIFLGVMRGDTSPDGRWMAERLAQLRVFEDVAGKMNLGFEDLLAAGGSPGVLMVSQFTLAADISPGLSKGNRPYFGAAMEPASAAAAFEEVAAHLRQLLPPRVALATGVFGASMLVRIDNDGPLTLWLDSSRK